MRWLLLLLPLLLIGCGGGGDSSSPPVVTPPPVARPIDFTFFGQSDLVVTAPFISIAHIVDWGAWQFPAADIKSRQIEEMQQARARGVDRFILSTGFLQFDAHCNYQGNAALAAYKLQLDALDLSRSVIMLYPLDEPDGMNCSGATMAQAYDEAKNIWPGIRIGVIYGNTGRTPGIDRATDVGRDWYSHGPQILDLQPGQSLMLIAGGVDPARDNVQDFVDYAKNHTNVSIVWAFLYVPYIDPAGHQQQGIGTNGMLPAYRAAGCTLTMKC